MTPRTEAQDAATAAPAQPKRRRSEGRESDFDARPETRDAAEGLTSESGASEPSEEDIRLRAYHRYLERGGGHGMDFEDWLEAERELKQRR